MTTEPSAPDDPFDSLDLAVLRDVLRDSPAGVAMLDRDLRIRWVNERFASISRVPGHAQLGRTGAELWGATAEPVEAVLRYVVESGETQVLAVAGRDADRATVDVNVMPLHGSGGAIHGVMLCAVEQAGRVELLEAQAELRRGSAEDRARLQAVLTHAPLAIAVVDSDGSSVLYSRAVLDLFGEPRVDQRGRLTFTDWQIADGRDPRSMPLMRTLREGVVVRGETVEIVRSGGDPATLLISSAPVFHSDGHLQFAVMSATDVTELRRARDMLRASRRSVQAALIRLRRVHELTATLARAREVTDVLTPVSRFVADGLGAAQATLALLDEGRQTLVPRPADEAPATGLVGRQRTAGPSRSWLTGPGNPGLLRWHADVDALLADYPELSGEVDGDAPGPWVSLPLMSSGRALGVYLVGWAAAKDLTAEDRADLELLATQAAVALSRILLDEQRRTVVETLQVALLPPTLPTVAGLSLLARYRPSGQAAAVGGDWFDAIATSRGLVLSVGDVAGHGMASAATMAHLRSAARAYAVEGHDPAAVLGLLDGLLAGSGDDLICSAVIATVDVVSGTVEWACAGHPPPLLVRDGAVELLSAAKGRVLGLGRTAYHSATLPFPLGAALMLYTDGLVERRDATVGSGIEELSARVSASFPGDLESIDALIDGMVAAPHHNDDDLCVLVARREAGAAPTPAVSRTPPR